MTSVVFDMASQRAIQEAVFALISEEEAKAIKQEAREAGEYDEDDGYNTEALYDMFVEAAQDKVDADGDLRNFPPEYRSIIQCCLEAVDWENHPNFPQ